ncbi:Sec-independent protein translocase subunit TatA/TatB [Candidatus Walczuchella endosymbiont of Icerya purchasi]|uniref:Sec-independent protein translocase subunit TatA/TatB n=1 Tax=Candidatus Walczuchella endosymbiont of Icerya purchasi TaxID=3066219 RepID=UPI00313C5A97
MKNITSVFLANFGPSQLIVILALLLFGGELLKGLGTGLREFKKAAQGDDYEEKKRKEGYDVMIYSYTWKINRKNLSINIP